ncbi:hypothetical protein [Glutamicibacter soli]
MERFKAFAGLRKKPRRVLRLRLELAATEEHKNKKISQIERELLGNDLKSKHGITGKVLGVDGEWGHGKENYTVWFWRGKFLYLLSAVVPILILGLAISRIPELGREILSTILLALSIWMLFRDIWNGWIGVSALQAVLAATAIATSWQAPLKLCAIIFN